MLNRIYWYVPDRVLIVEYGGYITLEDMIEADKIAHQMISHLSNPRQIHYMVDARQRNGIDPALQRWHNLRQYIRPLEGWLVVVDPQPHQVVRFLIATMCQVLRIRFRMYKTFEEATNFLARVDTDLREWL